MQEKRIRVRAIIIHDHKVATMYREREGKIFYTFPGGGIEANETEEQCVIREVLEELGIDIKPIKKVYTYENQYSIEHFYVCEWVSGEFGTGKGEEFQKNQTNGVYIPKLIDISEISHLPLMPPEVTTIFINDYKANGEVVRKSNDVVFLSGLIK